MLRRGLADSDDCGGQARAKAVDPFVRLESFECPGDRLVDRFRADRMLHAGEIRARDFADPDRHPEARLPSSPILPHGSVETAGPSSKYKWGFPGRGPDQAERASGRTFVLP